MMNNISEEIINIQSQLATIPKGYISKKVIGGKERYYLQWLENGKIKSKYIKNTELDSVNKRVAKRKELQEKLKELMATTEGKQETNTQRKAVRNMINITGTLMSSDTPIAQIKNGVILSYDEKRIPLYLGRTKNVEGWLASRAIDTHRVNSRLLKKVLRLRTTDDAQTALAVNAATLTDLYWFKPEGSKATYEDIRFKENYFDSLALRGDPDSFSRKPSRTPELTNIGSFEKCWRLIDGEWWMYKSGNSNEYFSELFICELGEKLHMDMAHYEMDSEYIRTKNFTEGLNVNFEPIQALVDDDEDYSNCFNILFDISPEIAKQYLKLIFMDTLCYNMDRHTQNFGLLRDAATGEIIKLAPNYDNNIALISRGYPNDISRESDGLIRFFREFVQSDMKAKEMYRELDIPAITMELIDECLSEISIDVDSEYIGAFILNGLNSPHKMNHRVSFCGGYSIFINVLSMLYIDTDFEKTQIIRTKRK